MMQRQKFKEFIISTGEETLAKKLNVSSATVQSWRYNRRQPTVRLAKEIMRLTSSNLKWEDIYGSL
jgi:DNA-binding XRE family transcriptional regulator